MKERMFGIAFVALLVLSACGGNTDTNTATSDSAASADQVIQVSTAGELSTLDSGQYTDVNSSDMIGQVTEGLYRLDANGDPELAIAASEPEVSDDGLIYTFTLRDAKWSNGDTVKASDFVYAFQYLFAFY